jgi:hypothetical protein
MSNSWGPRLDGSPVWTRFELAKGVQGTFRMARDPPGAAVSEQPLRWMATKLQSDLGLYRWK